MSKLWLYKCSCWVKESCFPLQNVNNLERKKSQKKMCLDMLTLLWFVLIVDSFPIEVKHETITIRQWSVYTSGSIYVRKMFINQSWYPNKSFVKITPILSNYVQEIQRVWYEIKVRDIGLLGCYWCNLIYDIPHTEKMT